MTTLGDIAEAPGVSVNTAKTHVRSTCNKSGAGTCGEAIGIGRAHELL